MDKKEPLIRNNASNPYLQNSCCDSKTIDVHKYFVKEDSLINSYNNIVIDLDKMINLTNSLSTAPLFYDPTDTKYKFTAVDSYFSKNTIYRAFIVFCKNTELQLSDELKSACQLKKKISSEKKRLMIK